jgi:hypothetical protein
VIENDGSELVANPSLALITMCEYVLTLEGVGLPLSAPVELLKVAQEGLFLIANRSVRPFGSDAVGVKEYD